MFRMLVSPEESGNVHLWANERRRLQSLLQSNYAWGVAVGPSGRLLSGRGIVIPSSFARSRSAFISAFRLRWYSFRRSFTSGLALYASRCALNLSGFFSRYALWASAR